MSSEHASNKGEEFADRLLAWFDRFGRKDLPWHRCDDPYPIWVSEIMLQQTQVATVLPYFERFMARFPHIPALARGDLDEVLHLWTGLGYYARARNLHGAAQKIVTHHGGRFPDTLEDVTALPGIGRSTAGAILAFAFGQRHPILDGNVKRVLTRCFRIQGWPGEKNVENRLWALAEQLTPNERVGDYTQAIMDLGATLCRRTPPACTACPQVRHCAAYRHDDQARYPTRRPRRRLPEKSVAMLMIRNARDEILLQHRPPTGVWGGLWSLPECEPGEDIPAWCRERLGLEVTLEKAWPRLRHTFSHFHLHITPIPGRLARTDDRVMENDATVWYKPMAPDARGLPAPVKRLLEKMRTPE